MGKVIQFKRPVPKQKPSDNSPGLRIGTCANPSCGKVERLYWLPGPDAWYCKRHAGREDD